MVYTLNIDNSTKKIFKRLPNEIRKVLIEKTQVLKDNPYTGEQLKGKYRLLRSLHCSIKGTAYRIIYQIFPSAEKIFIRLVGSRENIYSKLDEMKVKL